MMSGRISKAFRLVSVAEVGKIQFYMHNTHKVLSKCYLVCTIFDRKRLNLSNDRSKMVK